MPSNDKLRTYPSTPEERREVWRIGLVLIGSAYVFQIILALLVGYDVIKFHPSTVTEESLKGFSARFEYALHYQTLLAFWLLFNITMTIYRRLTRGALNPLDESTEDRVQWIKCVLTNSLESIVLSVFLQLIFVSYATPACILRFIPLVNIVQFIGRIAFYAGYPMYRAFGFNCTLLPNTLMGLYNLYKFGSFVQLY